MKGWMVPDGPPWDDGEKCKPGDPGFSTAAIIAHAAGKMFSYICTPNWKPEEV